MTATCLDTAAVFLATLAGPGEAVTFQTFDDSPEKRPDLTHLCHGTIEENFDKLNCLNESGAGVFVTVNKTDLQGRRESNVTGLRALFVDGDGIHVPSFQLPPNIIEQRDATHWHAYWLLKEGEPLAEFRAAQKHLAAYYGTDSKVCDLPRVMRVPGFLHRKGEPVELAIIRNEPAPRRTIAEILAAHPVAAPEPMQTAQPVHTAAPLAADSAEKSFRAWAAKKAVEATNGNRNNCLFEMAAFGAGRGVSEAIVLEVCMTYANGLSENEVRVIVKSAFSKERTAPPPPPLRNPPAAAPVTEASPQASPWPEIEDLRQVMDNPPPRPAELIEGVCFEGSKIYLAAPSKARKSFFQIHLALCLATGAPWFGKTVKRGRVLYINFELRPWAFQNRARQIAERLEVVLESDWLDVWNLRGMRVNVVDLASWLGRIEPGRYALIVFDPLYKLLGDREENKAGDMADLMGHLEAIASRAGSAILFAHHFGKGSGAGKDSLDRGAGSGVLGRDCDLSLTLTPHKEDEHFVLESVHRDFKPMPSVTLAWRYPLYETTDLNPKDLKRANARTRETKPKPEGPPLPPAMNTAMFVQTYLGETPRTKGYLYEKAEGAGLTPNKVDHFLESAIGAGKAFKWSNGPKAKASYATVPQPLLNDNVCEEGNPKPLKKKRDKRSSEVRGIPGTLTQTHNLPKSEVKAEGVAHE